MLLGLAGVHAKNFGPLEVKGLDDPIYVVGPDWTADFIKVLAAVSIIIN